MTQHDRFSLNPVLYGKVCRTCLCEGELTPISEETFIRDTLFRFFSIHMNEAHSFPRNICEACVDELTRIHAFSKRCEEVQEILQIASDERCPKIVIDDETPSSLPPPRDDASDVLQSSNHENTPDEKTYENVCKGLKKHRCEVCNHHFKYKAELNRHKKAIHTEDPLGDAGGNACTDEHKKTYHCDDCKESFHESSAYEAHVAQHKKNTEDFTCKACRKVLDTRHALKMHLRVHIDKTCSKCDKSFSKRGTLRKHLLVHSGEKPNVCCYCGRAFTWMNNLTRHEQAHANEKPQCASCFGLRPIDCSSCGKKRKEDSGGLSSRTPKRKRISKKRKEDSGGLSSRTTKRKRSARLVSA